MSDNVDRLVRPMIRGLEPYVPIEPPEVLAKREGIAPEDVIKMDANENPYGPSEKVAEALGIVPGSVADLDVKRDKLIITPRPHAYRLDDLLAGITAGNLHQEVQTGAAVGAEGAD